MVFSFKLNGKDVKINTSPTERLSTVLRTQFGLKSIKIASFDGLRGGDCVLLDGNVVPSSLVPMFNVENREVVSLEYCSVDNRFASLYKLIVKCFKMHSVNLCGFCDAGKIFATYKIIKEKLDEEDVDFELKIKQYYSISLCRCTVFENLLLATKDIISLSLKSKRTQDYGRK